MSRHHPLAGIRNFRDFGDYGAGARRIKKGVLYRSAHHAQATDEDLAAIAALKVATIVDLRRRAEREEYPSRRWNAFAAQVIDNEIDEADHLTYEEEYFAFLGKPGLTPRDVVGWGLTWYATAPFEPRHIDLFARYFQALAQSEGPILIHCAGGKDRTGILAALTHHIAGVHHDDIIADYLLTNRPEVFEQVSLGTIEFLKGLGDGSNARAEIARAIIEVTPAHMDSAFGAMRTRSGSIDKYLAQELGVDAKLRGAIEQRILE